MSDLTETRLAELAEASRDMRRWQDEDLASEQECVSCDSSVHTPNGLEPAPLCDLCAQRFVVDGPDIVDEIVRHRAMVKRLEALAAELDGTYGLPYDVAAELRNRMRGDK